MVHITDKPAVFDTALYEETVLKLPNNLSEREVNAQCHDEANRQGILSHTQENHHAAPIIGPRDSLLSFSPSATTHSTASLRSPSIDSRLSYSTDLTSNLSSTSTDHRSSRVFSIPLRSLSRLSSRDGHETATTSSAHSQTSLSSSPRSTFSNASILRSNEFLRKPFSVRRGLGRLSMFRKSSPTPYGSPRSLACYQCPNNGQPAEPAVRLDCGHGLCHEHFLQLVATSVARPQNQLSTCCGKRVSHSNSHALFRDHRHRNLAAVNELPADSRITSTKTDAGLHIRFAKDESQEQRPFERPRARLSLISPSISEAARKNLAEAMEFPDFQSLRGTQFDMADRFLKFRAEQHAKLSEFYASMRHDRVSEHELRVDALRETHVLALSKLEELQLSAEIDLREVHEQDKFNCLLALRHMEGYVESHDPLGSGRTVTEQDKRELEKQYWLRDHLDQRHESAINVLREQQARQSRIRAQNQERELVGVELGHQHNISGLDRAFRTEALELDELFMRRRERLVLRWSLTDEIWRRQHNDKENVQIAFPIAPLDWPLTRDLVGEAGFYSLGFITPVLE